MYYTTMSKVQAFLAHLVLPEAEQRRIAEGQELLTRYGDDGPDLHGFFLAAGGHAWGSEGSRWFHNEEDISKWHGVTCDAQGHIVGLNLFNTGIKGPVPAEL